MKLTKIALGVALSAGIAGQVAASDMLFPYVVKGGNVTTVLSFINTAPGFGGVAPATVYGANRWARMALNYKIPNAAGVVSNAAECQHVDRRVATSLNDLTSVDLGARFGAGALFGDTVGGAVAGAANDQGFLQDIAAIPAFRGYVSMWNPATATSGDTLADLYVTNANLDVLNDTSDTLQGDALIVDFSSGAAWGYRALNRAVTDTAGDGDALVDAIANWNSGSNVTWNLAGPQLNLPFFPLTEVQTRMFVTALNNTPTLQWNGTPGSVNVTLGGGVGNTLYNRLEVGSSLNTTLAANCFGVMDLEDLLGAAASFDSMQQGGFAPMAVTAGTANLAHVIKLEFGKTNTLNGVATGGTYNNAYVLGN